MSLDSCLKKYSQIHQENSHENKFKNDNIMSIIINMNFIRTKIKSLAVPEFLRTIDAV